MEFKGITLLGTATAYVNAFLGILPMRDDPGPGVEVRYVYPKSPADAAGLKAGDRIMKMARQSGEAEATGCPGRAAGPIQNRTAFLALMQRLTPGTEVTIEVKRKDGGKTSRRRDDASSSRTPDGLPEKLPLPSSAGKALRRPAEAEEGLPKDPFPAMKPRGRAQAEEGREDAVPAGRRRTSQRRTRSRRSRPAS